MFTSSFFSFLSQRIGTNHACPISRVSSHSYTEIHSQKVNSKTMYQFCFWLLFRTSTAANNTLEKKQREAFTTRSKYFKRLDKPEDLSSNASNQTKLSLLTKDVTGSRQPHLSDERSAMFVMEMNNRLSLNV